MRRRLTALVALVALVAMGCSNYTKRSLAIKSALAESDYAGALQDIEKIDRGRSELLYYYEKGLVLHYNDDYVSSNEAFEQAEIVLDDLYTKSVTREAAALAINDNIAKYRGDAHEAVLVNYYKILNYLHLGDIEGATVECRRVAGKLQRVRDAEGSYFEDDPFLHYLTAMVFELDGDRVEAEVSYRLATEAYGALSEKYGIRAPSWLYCDAAQNAYALGDRVQAESYRPDSLCMAGDPLAARVNLFIESGYVSYKVQETVELPILKDEDDEDRERFATTLASRRGHHYRKAEVDYWLKVANPALMTDPPPFSAALVSARPAGTAVAANAAPAEARTARVENVSALAQLAFDDKAGKVFVRSIVRALAKYAAKKKADKSDKGLGVLVNVLGVATESADTRSWSTLPANILMARLDLPEGTWDLDVELLTSGGETHDHFTIPGVEISGSRTRFINYRVH